MEFNFDWFVTLMTLTGLELILGIDNIVVLTILVEKLPYHLKSRARRLGLGLAFLFRVLFLLTVVWLTKLTSTLFSIYSKNFSLRDLILIAGGLFLLTKATTETFRIVELRDQKHDEIKSKKSFFGVILQIVAFDLIFSLDSVLTAVGLTEKIWVMIIAVLLSVSLTMIFAESIGNFVESNPTIKVLALSFLILIGVLLVAEGAGNHFERGYVYFAMAFSLCVELLNRRRARQLKELHKDW